MSERAMEPMTHEPEHAPHPDTLVRIACCVWLTALDSGLTTEQADWLQARLQSREPFTPQERAKLKGPLLAWATRQGMGETVAAQFEDVREANV